MRQPSSGNPSNNPFLDATMQLPQLRERNPATPGHTICCPAPRHCLSEHVSVPEGMCQVSDTNAVMPSCTALKRISPGNDWWFCCSPPTATAPQVCEAQLHCSLLCLQPSAAAQTPPTPPPWSQSPQSLLPSPNPRLQTRAQLTHTVPAIPSNEQIVYSLPLSYFEYITLFWPLLLGITFFLFEKIFRATFPAVIDHIWINKFKVPVTEICHDVKWERSQHTFGQHQLIPAQTIPSHSRQLIPANYQS